MQEGFILGRIYPRYYPNVFLDTEKGRVICTLNIMLVRQDRDLNKGIENFPEEKSNRQKSKKITNQTDSRQTIKQTEENPTNRPQTGKQTNHKQMNMTDTQYT